MRRIVFRTSMAATVIGLVVTSVLTYTFLPEVESSLILAVVGIGLAVVIPLGSLYYNQPNFDIVVKEETTFTFQRRFWK